LGCQDTNVSSLWTPGGTHDDQQDRRPPPSEPAAGAREGTRDADQLSPAEAAAARAELARLQSELRATPVGDIIANHAIGLWQLALLHLGLEDRDSMNLGEAGLAIDAVGALVDGLGARLGRHEPALRDALTQLRLAFVQQTNRLTNPGGEPS
jgi:hypothetical protein